MPKPNTQFQTHPWSSSLVASTSKESSLCYRFFFFVIVCLRTRQLGSYSSSCIFRIWVILTSPSVQSRRRVFSSFLFLVYPQHFLDSVFPSFQPLPRISYRTAIIHQPESESQNVAGREYQELLRQSPSQNLGEEIKVDKRAPDCGFTFLFLIATPKPALLHEFWSRQVLADSANTMFANMVFASPPHSVSGMKTRHSQASPISSKPNPTLRARQRILISNCDSVLAGITDSRS